MKPLRARAAYVGLTNAHPTLTILLVGGAQVTIPLSKIKGFTPSRLRFRDGLVDAAVKHVRVEDRGASISFPDMDIDFSVAEKVPEFLGITTASAAARRAGSVASAAKAAAARANGSRGGRPRKTLVSSSR